MIKSTRAGKLKYRADYKESISQWTEDNLVFNTDGGVVEGWVQAESVIVLSEGFVQFLARPKGWLL